MKVEVDKSEQSSDWGSDELSVDQINYAMNDVKYLEDLHLYFSEKLNQNGRINEFKKIMEFIPTRCQLDLMGWNDTDIFSH